MCQPLLLDAKFYKTQSLFVIQLLSHIQLFATPWTAACQASLSFTISQSLLKLISIESVIPSNHLILCCPLLPSPPAFYLSQHQGLSQRVGSSRQVAYLDTVSSYLEIHSLAEKTSYTSWHHCSCSCV